MTKDDCLFCKIGKGEIPSATIFENDEFKCFLDVAPASRGHALIIPKEHYSNIFELDKSVAGKLFTLATDIAAAIKEETGCQGMNLIQNNDECAGQTVHHFHLHLIPRNPGDGVGIGWPQGKADLEENAKLAEAIKNRL